MVFRGLLDVGGLPHAREVGEVGHLLLVGVLEDGLEALHRAERRAEQEARRVDGRTPGVAVVDDGARGEDRISVRVGAVRKEVHQTGRVEPAARFVVQVAALLLRVGEVGLLGEPLGDVGPDVSRERHAGVEVLVADERSVFTVAVARHAEADVLRGAADREVVVLREAGLHHAVVDVLLREVVAFAVLVGHEDAVALERSQPLEGSSVGVVEVEVFEPLVDVLACGGIGTRVESLLVDGQVGLQPRLLGCADGVDDTGSCCCSWP